MFFTYFFLNEFYFIYNCTMTTNFIAFPSQTPSASPHPQPVLKRLLRAFFVPNPGDSAVNKQIKMPCPQGADVLV